MPLPNYPLKTGSLPRASALVFYGSPGNRVTELVGGRLYDAPYTPVPFHAALYLSKGECLNVGATKTVHTVEKEFKDTRRLDLIVYDISVEQRDAIEKAGRADTSKVNSPLEKLLRKPLFDYAWTDFLRFGFKWFKPSKKDFCSENVVENMAEGGVTVSPHEAVNTAPWDLVEWAEAHPEIATIYTLWEGDVFKAKLGRK